jgi:hypothetical protein
MNPSESGWLSEFVDYRKSAFGQNKEFNKTKLGNHPDQSFYGIIQPTGIMYGYPVNKFGFNTEHEWGEEEKIKLLLADSLFNIAELYNDKPIKSESEFVKLIEGALLNICDFYKGVYPEIAVSTKTWLGKKKETLSLAEQFIDKRVFLTVNKKINFWTNFFTRSQLFLDVYIFGQWNHTNPDKVLLEFFKGEKEELSFTSLKVLAAATHANHQIEDEERALFEHFISSTSLPAEKRRVAKEYFEHGLGIQELPIEESDSWIIRKFFLELAMLTVWSDKRVEEKEREFLKSFNHSLGFSDDDYEVSLIAVEGFLLQNWSQLENLQSKIDYATVSEEYIGHLIKMCARHINRLEKMVSEDSSLLAAIRRGNAAELSDIDKQLIRKKFLSILQSIPNFRVVMLPEEFLSYENLLRVVPKETIKRVLSLG